jgi:hypothetical protein
VEGDEKEYFYLSKLASLHHHHQPYERESEGERRKERRKGGVSEASCKFTPTRTRRDHPSVKLNSSPKITAGVFLIDFFHSNNYQKVVNYFWSKNVKRTHQKLLSHKITKFG